MKGISGTAIVLAAERRVVTLPGELAGYLVLGVLDSLDGQSALSTPENIYLTEDGRVGLHRVQSVSAHAAEIGYRQLLATLVGVSLSPSNALLRAGSPCTGAVATPLATELQAALVPVNRGAARRALARLYRELLRHPVVPAEVKPVLSVASDPPPSTRANQSHVDSGASACGSTDLKSKSNGQLVVARTDASVSRDAANRCRPSEIPDLLVPHEPACQFRAEGLPRSTIDDLSLQCTSTCRAEDVLTVAENGPAGSVVSPSMQCSMLDDADNPDDGPCSEPPIRETTLVLAPVAPRVNNPTRQAPFPNATQPDPLRPREVPQPPKQDRSAERTPASAEARRLSEPTGHTSPLVEQTLPLVIVAAASRPQSLQTVMPVVVPEIVEPTQALPLVTRKPSTNVMAQDAGPYEPSCWEATSIDAVVEVSDDEIIYDCAPSQEWVDVDCSDLMEFEVAIPAVRLLQRSGYVPEPSQKEPVLMDETSTAESEENRVAAAERNRFDEAELQAVTHYRSESQVAEPKRSAASRLVGQLGSEPLWSERELCKSLRAVVGLELTPCPPNQETATPPPTVAEPANSRVEPLEPTRKLGRTGASIAGLLVVATCVLFCRSPHTSTAAASELPIDALGQMCRASVVVEGIEVGQVLRLRQLGDARFREPTLRSSERAEFGGVRCSEDAELLVGDGQGGGVRRWPITSGQLQPQGIHPNVRLELRIDGET